MQARYQHGELKTRKRRRGPDVWQWRWYDEKGKRKAVIVGTTASLPTQRPLPNALSSLCDSESIHSFSHSECAEVERTSSTRGIEPLGDR